MKKVFLSIVLCSFLAGCSKEETKTAHACNWEDCDHVGQTDFVSQWGNPEGSDGYYCELTHFEHPQWSYEKCERYVMQPACPWVELGCDMDCLADVPASGSSEDSAHYYKYHNFSRCPYEGLECPNAQKALNDYKESQLTKH